MTRILPVAILAAIAFLCIPPAAAAQQASVDSLVRRVSNLERITIDLERRVRELEAISKSEPARVQSVSSPAKWRNVQNWRRLRRGMTMDEVRALVGEPDKVDAMGGLRTTWHWGSYGGAIAYFDGRSDRLEGWSEPERERPSDDTGQP
jgi:hypothetical protein